LNPERFVEAIVLAYFLKGFHGCFRTSQDDGWVSRTEMNHGKGDEGDSQKDRDHTEQSFNNIIQQMLISFSSNEKGGLKLTKTPFAALGLLF